MSPPLFGGDPEKKLLDEIREIVETAKKYQRAGKPDQAANEFRAALRTYNKYVEEVKKYKKDYSTLLTEVGRGLYALDEVERAIEALEKALQLDPKNVHAWLFKGSIHFANPGTANYAVICYSEAVKLDPKNVTAWRNLGDAYRVLGKNEDAILAYRNLIKVEPNNLANYDRILKINPNDMQALEGKAAVFAKQGKVDEAVEIYKLLFEMNPKMEYYDAVVTLKPDEAENLKRIAGAREAEIGPQTQQPVDQVQPQPEYPEVQQQVPQETEENEEELELLPTREGKGVMAVPEELPTLAKATPKPEELARELKPIELKTVKIEELPEQAVPQPTPPTEPEISKELAHILESPYTKESPPVEEIKRFVSENLDDKEKILIILDKLLEVERYADMGELMELILPVHTTDDVLWYYNGIGLAKLGKVKEALNSFTVSAKLNPEDPDVYLAIGAIYCQMRDYEKGTQALNEVLKRRPKEGEAWYLKSVLEAINGDYNKAKAFLKQAAVLNEEFKERARSEKVFEPLKDDPMFQSIVR
ncbi:MAG: tetratricopeptide repeat protein [Thermoplasmata archaeon]|nr:tetratricopeptide repeat protein [Thermoplasmata archaeon]